MMHMQEFFKEKKWKKIRKDQWLIVLLAGILLLVIAVPADCGAASANSSSGAVGNDAEDMSSGSGGNDTEDMSSGSVGNDAEDIYSGSYAETLENRLEQALSRMEGVGQVQVMITLKDDGESVVEKDVSTTGDTQTDTDGESSTTDQTRSERSEETVYSPQSGDGEPFVSKQISPEIEGILVVAEGGGDTETVKNISEAAEALFGLEAHKIKVVKMNLQEGSN